MSCYEKIVTVSSSIMVLLIREKQGEDISPKINQLKSNCSEEEFEQAYMVALKIISQSDF